MTECIKLDKNELINIITRHFAIGQHGLNTSRKVKTVKFDILGRTAQQDSELLGVEVIVES